MAFSENLDYNSEACIVHINIFRRKKLGILPWNLIVHFQQCVMYIFNNYGKGGGNDFLRSWRGGNCTWKVKVFFYTFNPKFYYFPLKIIFPLSVGNKMPLRANMPNFWSRKKWFQGRGWGKWFFRKKNVHLCDHLKFLQYY